MKITKTKQKASVFHANQKTRSLSLSVEKFPGCFNSFFFSSQPYFSHLQSLFCYHSLVFFFFRCRICFLSHNCSSSLRPILGCVTPSKMATTWRPHRSFEGAPHSLTITEQSNLRMSAKSVFSPQFCDHQQLASPTIKH